VSRGKERLRGRSRKVSKDKNGPGKAFKKEREKKWQLRSPRGGSVLQPRKTGAGGKKKISKKAKPLRRE